MRLSKPDPKTEVVVLMVLISAVAVGLAAYRAIEYGVPLLPGAEQPVWVVGAEVRFKPTPPPEPDNRPSEETDPIQQNADTEGVKASMALPPKNHSGVLILEEHHIAPGYGFHITDDKGIRRAVWTRRKAEGPQTLFYNLLVTESEMDTAMPASDRPPPLTPPVLDQDETAAAELLLTEARSRSADRTTFVQQLLKLLNEQEGPDAARMLLRNRSLTEAAALLMQWSRIPARQAMVLPLRGKPHRRKPHEMIDVRIDGQWRLFDPAGNGGTPEPYIVWRRGGRSLLDLSGGESAHVAFSVVEHRRPALTVSRHYAMNGDGEAPALSLFRLPLYEQNVFKRLLVVPIAALLVVLMRNVVGVLTSGTFMPVLLALAFLDTQLIPGVVLILIVIAAGVLIRSYLSHLSLLLVARIAVALIVVVFLMMGLSLASWHIGLLSGLKVSVFPIIIIAWTIERLAVTIEEDGGWIAMQETLGTLAVSVLCFFVMANRYVEHLSFNFPELNLLVLAVTLWLGTYTGYRLSELYRFRHVKAEEGD
ncbi:MAG: UUP1 family membrane protein [Phycisphaeraceae bacterium]|nr:UUP1 family membrane protein [Phycisphaeraceae bacterium]